MGEAKRGAPIEKARVHVREMMLEYIFNEIFFGEEKTRQENGELDIYFILFKIILFGHIFKKSAHSFFEQGHSSWSTIDLHLVRGPKAL